MTETTEQYVIILENAIHGNGGYECLDPDYSDCIRKFEREFEEHLDYYLHQSLDDGFSPRESQKSAAHYYEGTLCSVEVDDVIGEPEKIEKIKINYNVDGKSWNFYQADL